MEKNEINQRSPLRALQNSIRGGLGAGNIGVIVARHGVGKTAFLVGLGLDKLLRGRKVLHVSLGHAVDKVCAYYDDIFADLAREHDLDDVWRVRVEMERNRRIHVFPDGTLDGPRLRHALAFMKEHMGFAPSSILIDDYDFGQATPGALKELRALATETGDQIWMTAITSRDAAVDGDGIPEPVSPLKDEVDVILRMAHDGDSVRIHLLKEHDRTTPSPLDLALDPRTLLLVRD